MDTLTHGLLGAATALLPLPRRLRDDQPEPAATRAAIVVGVLAAELPDLDYLLPAGDEVLHALRAHRGLSHSLIAVPVVALAAALLTKLLFRRARLGALYARALFAVPVAHLLPDLWTGWGTRLLLPFSERRLALDWTMVVDPFFTLPVLAAAIWAAFRRGTFRRAFGWGVLVSATYLVVRVALAQVLTAEVRRAYPEADAVNVFPSLFGVTSFRYVATVDGEYRAGSVALGSAPDEQGRSKPFPTGPLSERLKSIPTLREALVWARFPVVRAEAEGASGYRVEVADLRYHLRGQPTLAFVMSVQDDRVTEARLERGGSARELFDRYRQK
jgi:inner membrane protein